MELKHKKVVTEHYEINLGGTHRTLGGYIDKFLDGAPDAEDEDAWSECHTVLRDYEGDFDGIEIYSDERIEKIIKFIYHKIGIDYESNKHLSIKIVS